MSRNVDFLAGASGPEYRRRWPSQRLFGAGDVPRRIEVMHKAHVWIVPLRRAHNPRRTVGGRPAGAHDAILAAARN
jgi:hypothetical protein